ncbi:MAG: hypothetical protein ABIL92_04725 [candidate division WOR-3 bacterium]
MDKHGSKEHLKDKLISLMEDLICNKCPKFDDCVRDIQNTLKYKLNIQRDFWPRGVFLCPDSKDIKLLVIANNPGPYNEKLDKDLYDPDWDREKCKSNLRGFLGDMCTKWVKLCECWERNGFTGFHKNLCKLFKKFNVSIQEVYLTEMVKCGGFDGTNVPDDILARCKEEWLKKELEILTSDNKKRKILILGQDTCMGVLDLICNLNAEVYVTLQHPSVRGYFDPDLVCRIK